MSSWKNGAAIAGREKTMRGGEPGDRKEERAGLQGENMQARRMNGPGHCNRTAQQN